MKLATREGMVPGKTLEEKLDRLEELGYAAIEVYEAGTLARGAEELARAFRGRAVGVANVGGPRGLLDPDPATRAESLALLRSRLELAARLDAVGVLVVPIFGRPLLPDLSPYRTAVELETELLLAEIRDVAPLAERLGRAVILEPLNRYETHFVNRLEQGVALCQAIGSPGIRIMADFFHMHIEEADIPASIRAAGEQIVYVHVADSNRKQPGRGHLDLRSGFAALKAVGYDGYLGVECGLLGDPSDALREAAANVRQAWDAA